MGTAISSALDIRRMGYGPLDGGPGVMDQLIVTRAAIVANMLEQNGLSPAAPVPEAESLSPNELVRVYGNVVGSVCLSSALEVLEKRPNEKGPAITDLVCRETLTVVRAEAYERWTSINDGLQANGIRPVDARRLAGLGHSASRLSRLMPTFSPPSRPESVESRLLRPLVLSGDRNSLADISREVGQRHTSYHVPRDTHLLGALVASSANA